MINEIDPKREPCPTKAILLETWQSTAEIYSKAVADLSRQIGVLPKADYDKLSHAAEQTRKRSIKAQQNLEAHLFAHGCDGGKVAA